MESQVMRQMKGKSTDEKV